MKSARLWTAVLWTAVVLTHTQSAAADTLIYNNAVYAGYFTPGYNYEIYDYGTSPGGYISKFTFGYRSTSVTPTVIIRFFHDPNIASLNPGYQVKYLVISNLPSTGGTVQFYEYVIPEADRFTLPSGNFGYSITCFSATTQLALASGGAGNANELWEYDNFYPYGWGWHPFWFDGTPWAGLYMKIYTGPPINEITCSIEGYKFDDLNANTIWDDGEPALPGWEIFLDLNNNGAYEASEPNAVTDPNGFYRFEYMSAPATYRVREILKDGWTQTLPGPALDYRYNLFCDPNTTYGPYNFGNTTTPVKYGGGEGTETDPYLISAPAHLQQLGATPADWAEDIYFSLVADLNMSGYTGTSFNIIGTSPANPFRGTFKGNDHTISNFTYATTASTSHIGLFGCLDGLVTDLKLSNPSVYAPNTDFVGALAGYLGAWISRCTVESGTVTGKNCVGGISGYSQMITSRFPTIYYSYATCSVTGNEDVGGIAGRAKHTTIRNCYSTSSVTGVDAVAGLLGRSDSPLMIIEHCYAAGPISAVYGKGAILAAGGCQAMECFWDIQTTNCAVSIGGTPKTTLEMNTADTFARWGCAGAWTLNEGIDYPRLAFQNLPGAPLPVPAYGGGSGTEEDPYLIDTAEHFNDIGKYECHNTAFFKLTNDIEFFPSSSNNFIPVGYLRGFSGTFDGNSHVIVNPVFAEDNPARFSTGLFASVGTNLPTFTGSVKNLGVLNPNIASVGDAVGGLCGYLNKGTIENCFVRGGAVSGSSHVGGLAGVVDNLNARIDSSYAHTSVSGIDAIGGLAGGFYRGLIEHSYAAGPVSGDEETGGLIGYYYFEGQVISAFYDADTTGQSGGPGTPLSTAQMRSVLTYVNWDFIDIWRICDGTNYPRLLWEPKPVGDLVCPDGVGPEDLILLADEWLMEVIDLSADIAPASGDGRVDMLDWLTFAQAWLTWPAHPDWDPDCNLDDVDNFIDIGDLQLFADQWLVRTAQTADIAPPDAPDGLVNLLDFALLAQNWLTGTD